MSVSVSGNHVDPNLPSSRRGDPIPISEETQTQVSNLIGSGCP